MKRAAFAAAMALALAGTAQAAVTELQIFKQPHFRGASQTVKGEVNVLEGGFARQAESVIARGGYWEVCTEDRFRGGCHVLAPGEYPRLGPELNRQIVSTRFLGTDEKVARRALKEERREWREARREWMEDRREARQERREERREERWRERHAGSVDLYGRPYFRGRSVRVEGAADDLYEHRFDGRASSLVVNQGTWQLCSEPRFEGICRVYEPGEYPRLAELDDRVSSIRRVR